MSSSHTFAGGTQAHRLVCNKLQRKFIFRCEREEKQCFRSPLDVTNESSTRPARGRIAKTKQLNKPGCPHSVGPAKDFGGGKKNDCENLAGAYPAGHGQSVYVISGSDWAKGIQSN